MKNKIYIILLLLFAMVTGALAQNLVEVSGKVLDEKGEPIIGASIVEAANPTNGISSDVSGRFRLKVKSVNATLNVFFIGYQPASVVAEKGKELIIRLKEDQKMLDEVQVTVNVGYGTQSRVTHTGFYQPSDEQGTDAEPCCQFAKCTGGENARFVPATNQWPARQ